MSTGRQARNGLSLGLQEERIRSIAKAQGADLVDMIVEPGKSARSLRRPGVGRILEMARLRLVDAVIIYKLDRLSRSLRDLTQLLSVFQRKGIALISVTDNLDTSSPTGRLVIHILGAVAEMESEQIGGRVADAHAVKRAKGERMGEIPFGHRLADNGVHLEQDPGEQRNIRAMKRLRRKGYSYAKVAARLNERGIWTRKGTDWKREYIYYILNKAPEKGREFSWHNRTGARRQSVKSAPPT